MRANTDYLIDEFEELTKAVNGLLAKNDFDKTIEVLRRRENILTELNKEINSKELASKKSTLESIIQIDKQNMEILNRKTKKTVQALTALAKEKMSIQNLRSIARISQRQIVDLRH